MKHFKGQKIQEGTDFMRIPSLVLSPDELSSIPDTPSFEDSPVSSSENLQELSASKQGNRNISKGKLSRTIRFKHRLSSIASGYSFEEHEVGIAEAVEMRVPTVVLRKFTPTMDKLAEENYAIDAYNSNSSLKVFQTQLEHNILPSDDYLYGDDHHEESHILNTRLIGNQTTETFTTANDVLIDEIVDSYKNDYMDMVEQYYQPSGFKTDFPLKLNNKEVVLHPPVLNKGHQHTTSIHTASDMSTLPEKLFSSPEIDNRSCASSVYSEISDDEFLDDDDDLKRETIHRDLYSSEFADFTSVMNIIDEYEDDYVIQLDPQVEWVVHRVTPSRVLKPKIVHWDDDFDSSDDEDFFTHMGNRAISENDYSYTRHFDDLDINSLYEDDILSVYSEITNFTNTATTFNSGDFFETHEYVQMSLTRD